MLYTRLTNLPRLFSTSAFKMSSLPPAIKFSPIGFGLLGLSWRATSDAQAFATMKESITRGATFWVAGSFYNRPGQYLDNIRLI